MILGSGRFTLGRLWARRGVQLAPIARNCLQPLGSGVCQLLLKSSWVSNRVKGSRRQLDVSGEPMRGRTARVSDRCGSLFAAAALAISWAKPGLTDPLSEVRVRWEAPPDCPDRVALDQELRRDLEGSQAPSIRVRVDASVARLEAETWRVSIRTESSAGQSERTITAHSCSALVDATSLIIAMLIDPETAAIHARPIEGTSESAAPPIANPANSVPASSSTLPPAPPPTSNLQRNPAARETTNQNQNRGFIGPAIPSARAARWPASGLIAAWVAGDSGSLPSFTEVVGGSLGLLYGPWRAEASFGWWSPKSKVLNRPPNPGAAGEFGKLAGGATLCLTAWSPTPFALSPCAGLELARLSGTGSGDLKDSRTVYRWPVSAKAGVLGILNLTDALALRLDLDVLVPLNRPEFGYYVQGDQGQPKTIFQPPLIAARFGLGVELHFR